MRIIISKLLVILFITVFSNKVIAQNSYWVFLTDKNNVEFNPYQYFDAKAIERRIKNNIAINHPSDWPLNKSYVNSISEIVDSITGRTRWFNAIAIIANEEQISQISKLSFVSKIEAMEYYAVLASVQGCYPGEEYSNLRNKQLDILGRKDFEDQGFRGKGIRVAIFDGGFPGVNTIDAFEQIRNENRIIKTWDFTKDAGNVYYSISHGTEVMSNIGGQVIQGDDTIAYGLATEAEFLLAKTEIKREPFSEEKNWLMAVEWADKNGADIINSSLGYTNDRYFISDMDGKKSLVAKAGNMAARKGILVVNAAGNDGDSKWHVIGTPADADSVLAVGGIDPNSGFHTSFSSFGPTADGRMKPNVCAFGTTMVMDPDNNQIQVDGTSFASPLVAGFAACALQANPSMKNMDLFRLIEESGHLYPYFDYAHGYGIPQAKYVISKKKDEIKTTFVASYIDGYLQFAIAGDMPLGAAQLMYLKVEKSDGSIIDYQVIDVNQSKFKYDMDWPVIRDNVSQISIFYKGYIQIIKL